MFFNFSSFRFFYYLLRRRANKFFISIAIRSFALGMVLIFEPIYFYLFFKKSLVDTLLFFALCYGLYGFLAVYGGKVMARIGVRLCILFSHFFFAAYYLCLFFVYQSSLFLILAVILRVAGMIFFWPAFHTDFIRFSEADYQGRAVGKMNIAFSLPPIISPAIGGLILRIGGYPVLFVSVLFFLLISSIPLFFSKEDHIIYSDSYKSAWRRISDQKDKKINIAFMAEGIEGGVNAYLWPLFMFALAISYPKIGGITTFSLGATALFTFYMGRLSDSISNRVWFLNIGSFLTSVAWIIKYFVVSSFDAFLAQTIYQISRASAGVPFQTFFYEKASLKSGEADEFVIYREIVVNICRSITFLFLAVIFFFTPQINVSFVIAAIASLGFMYLGLPPKIKER